MDRQAAVPQGRPGEGDEGAGTDSAGDGGTNQLVAGGRDPGHQRLADAAATGTLSTQQGYDEFDRRLGRHSPKRVPVATFETVLRLYQERYFDLNVRHSAGGARH